MNTNLDGRSARMAEGFFTIERNGRHGGSRVLTIAEDMPGVIRLEISSIVAGGGMEVEDSLIVPQEDHDNRVACWLLGYLAGGADT